MTTDQLTSAGESIGIHKLSNRLAGWLLSQLKPATCCYEVPGQVKWEREWDQKTNGALTNQINVDSKQKSQRHKISMP